MLSRRTRGESYKREIQGWKTIKAGGKKFTIRRLNPVLDFPADKMPQMFTDFLSRRQIDPARTPPIEELRRIQRDMYTVLEAGIVDPKLVPVASGPDRGREPGLTAADLFLDENIGYTLYLAILNHSLLRFGGFKGVFFSIVRRLSRFMPSRPVTASVPST